MINVFIGANTGVFNEFAEEDRQERFLNAKSPSDRRRAMQDESREPEASNTLVQTQVNVNDINQAAGYFTNVVNAALGVVTSVRDEEGEAGSVVKTSEGETGAKPVPVGLLGGETSNTIVQFQANVVELDQSLYAMTNVVNAALGLSLIHI